jgi:hypothetical protein
MPVERLPIEASVAAALKSEHRSSSSEEVFRAIWILEGIGHIKATGSSLTVDGLLQGELPGCALIPLHAGMGTAFAEKLLPGLGGNPAATEVSRTVERFVELCYVNCRPGWEDATIEPLGLVVRCLHPHLLEPVSAALEDLNPAWRRLFWHGVGRSLYFVPTNFMPIPGAHSRMLTSAAAEASDVRDRREVLAGLIWAVTLVNLPRPAVIRSLIPQCADMRIHAEFTNGLISALLTWRHMAPGDGRYIGNYTRALLTHDQQAVRWNSWIETPAREALETVWPGLDISNNVPALYSYRTPEELAELSAVAA